MKFKVGDSIRGPNEWEEAVIQGVTAESYDVKFADGSAGVFRHTVFDGGRYYVVPLLPPEVQSTPQPAPGVKADQGKPRLGILFQAALYPAIVTLVRVLEYGAKKYSSEDNWVRVENGITRYRDAALRHGAARAAGETHDTGPGGSGLPHMAHMACSALFSLALELASEAVPEIPWGTYK